MLSIISYACGQSSRFYEVSSQIFCSFFSVAFFFYYVLRLYILHTNSFTGYMFCEYSQFVACLLIFSLVYFGEQKNVNLYEEYSYLVIDFIFYTRSCHLQRNGFTLSVITWISFSSLIG